MPREHNYYVYLLTNFTNNVIYTGVTNNLRERVMQHREKTHKGFTAAYNVFKLVYFETSEMCAMLFHAKSRSRAALALRR